MVIACIVLLSGAFLFLASYRISQRYGGLDFALQGKPPQTLIAEGPYSLIRHPFYTSYILGWIGSTLAHGNYILILSLIVMMFFYLKAVSEEESSFALSSFSEKYEKYKKKSYNFVPFLW
jgi:protein-S-isoprenylcysteine O-methyltransferase Ste14